MPVKVEYDFAPTPLKRWREVLLADPCAYCGAPGKHVDHVVPSHAGGTDDTDNLIGACQRCNNSKAGKSLLAFLSGQAVGHRPNRSTNPSRHRTPCRTREKQRTDLDLWRDRAYSALAERKRLARRVRELEAELAEHRQAA